MTQLKVQHAGRHTRRRRYMNVNAMDFEARRSMMVKRVLLFNLVSSIRIQPGKLTVPLSITALF